ncbi:MAG: DUF1015 family protein [Sulfuricella sp.]
MGEHSQTGLVAAAAVADYDTNRIRKHEFTRPDKEDDRYARSTPSTPRPGRCCWPTPLRPKWTPFSPRPVRGSPMPTSPLTTASATPSG